MPLELKCDFCNKELNDLGMLTFIPPYADSQIVKLYICPDCFVKMCDLITSKLTNYNNNKLKTEANTIRFEKIKKRIENGDNFIIEQMPRGSGKTTLCKALIDYFLKQGNYMCYSTVCKNDR